MELDELKDIWKVQTEAEAIEMHVSPEEVSGMLQGRTRSVLGRINRNIVIETVMVILLGMVGAIWLYTRESELHPLEHALIPTYVIGSAVFYWYKYRMLNRIAVTTENLKDALTQLTNTMGTYMKIYFYGIITLVPALGVGGILYGFFKGSRDAGEEWEELPLEVWVILGITMVIYSVFAVFFSRWYLDKMYGVHYRELNLCLQELRETD